MIKAARRLINLNKDDLLRAGTYKITRQRLDQLERQICKVKQKSRNKNVIDDLAKEVVQLIGNICKSLVRYMFHFHLKIHFLGFYDGELIYIK
jgi:hypothetical protein